MQQPKSRKAGQHNSTGITLHSVPLDPARTEFCDEHFGEAWLAAWNATAREECHSWDPGAGVNSTLTCRELVGEEHMTQASRPHMLCSATNLYVDTSKFTSARCPRFRPGYLCLGPTYHRYSVGAFGLACGLPLLDLERFPRDHLRDIMAGMQAHDALHLPAVDAVDETPTLLVTREIREHANVFHMLTDMLNSYISVRTMGWEGLPRQVVLLDDHPPGPFDPLWAAVAAGRGREALAGPAGAGVRRAGDLPAKTLLKDAVFVPPGYSSLMFAHLYEANSCPQAAPLFIGFRTWMHASLGLGSAPSVPNTKLRVTFISRRADAGKPVVRGINNEGQILEMLQKHPGVNASLVDLSGLELTQQLETVVETDVLVGMHGAALAWSLLMREGAALLEMWSQQEGIWRCYQHTAEWAGLHYRRWENKEPAKVVHRGKGDSTEVDTAELESIFSELLKVMQSQRHPESAA